MANTWDPQQYRMFAALRLEPLLDLLALVEPDGVRSVADLGCGPGEMTVRIAEQLDAADVVGVDNSPDMLAAAAAHAGGAVRFETGDIGDWTADASFDLVFANASLQWVPDHASVLRRWTAALRPGGQLAVQVPANGTSASHTIAARLAEDEPFRSAFGPAGGSPFGPAGAGPDPLATNVRTPQWYARALHALGFEQQQVSLRVYPHLLPDAAAAVEWMKGTALTRYRAGLPPELYESFVAAYAERLIAELGTEEPLFFPFARILLWGRLPG